MNGTRFALAALALTGATASLAQAGGERLASPALSGYRVAHLANGVDQSLREEVPSGQTAQRWTRMVTTQRFTGLATRSTPAAYVRTIAASVPSACPGAGVSPIVNLAVSGRPAARFQVDCPRNQTGQPETFILLAVAGQGDMHVKQVAFRGPRTAAELAWARQFLASTALCRPGDAQPACR